MRTSRSGRGCGAWLLPALLLILLLPTAAFGVSGGDHVRVVLDTSMSMSGPPGPNDRGRLAILATMLLYDLVDPNPQDPREPDSFVVFPFAHWSEWSSPSQPPPTGTGQPIEALGQDTADREAFRASLQGLAYDAPWTYFYPGLKRAVEDVLAASGGPEDRRVVVLVTDGLPETEIKAREAELLSELRNQMLAAKVGFYVLAFGPTAASERDFFDQLFEGAGGLPLGELFVDPDGRDLVLNMARIFSRSFGYDVEHLGPGPAARMLDLDGGITPPKVAMVALRRGGGASPEQDFSPSVNAPRGVQKARSQGEAAHSAAYSMQMIEGVVPNLEYALDTGVAGVDMALLRKVEPELSVWPGEVELDGVPHPMRQAHRVMAETPFTLRILAASPIGTPGGQAEDLHVSARPHGPRKIGCEYDWTEGWIGYGARDSWGDGVAFDVRLEFPANANDPAAIYDGFVDAVAKFNEFDVDKLDCDDAHGLEVYPKIAIRTAPADGYLDPPSLEPGVAEQGCVHFRLETDEPQKLAVLQTELYRLRAYLEPGSPDLADGALAGAEYRLDREAVAFEDLASPWHTGRGLLLAELLGEHRFCVDLGSPNLTDPSPDLTLTLHLALDHTPYDDFRVIEPFRAKLRVVPLLPPSWADFPWAALWALLGPLLVGLAAMALIAPRWGLPDDLGYSLTRLDDTAASAGSPGTGEAGAAGDITPVPAPLLPLPPLAWWQRLPLPLGRRMRPLPDPGSDRVLAWVQPRSRELFSLRPAKGLWVSEGEGPALNLDRGRLEVQVHRDYRIVGDGGPWRLRLDYLDARSE